MDIGGNMKKVSEMFRNMGTVLILFSIVFVGGYYVGSRGNAKAVSVVEEKQGFDLELPMEVEKRVVTVRDIKLKLVDMRELSTYSGEYTVTYGKDEIRYMLDKIPVLGTTNSITLTCDGIVKIGYEISDIVVKIDDKKIYISLPEPKINDNYVIWDSIRCEEDNCILNPVEFSQYQEMIDEIEKMGLEKAIKEDIYEKAENNVKKIMKNFLSEFKDYEIIYM